MFANALLDFKHHEITAALKSHKKLEGISEKNIEVLLSIIEGGINGATARQISDNCDMTIYSVRHSLDKLEEFNLISRKPGGVTSKIFWIPGEFAVAILHTLDTRKIEKEACETC